MSHVKQRWLAALLLTPAVMIGGDARPQEKAGTKPVRSFAKDEIIKMPSMEQWLAAPVGEQELAKVEIGKLVGPYLPVKKTYSIYGNEFDSYHHAIGWGSSGGLVNRYVSSCGIAVCGLAAPVHVPDKARITGFRCKVVDNSPTHPVGLSLAWSKGDDLVSHSTGGCMIETGTASASPAVQTVASTACQVTVDNSTWAYNLRFDTYEGGSGATVCESGGAACLIYNCFVDYY